jgi:ribonuclease HI
MKKVKFYVVWKGNKPGIYHSWDECRLQVEGVAGAAYKSFPSLMEAEAAFKESPVKHIFKKEKETMPVSVHSKGKPIHESIVVDAAWNSVQKDMEYQGIFYHTGKRIFHTGPLANGTNNIGEFLAIVHALGYCKRHGLLLPVYSDSRNAISWVKNKKCKTNLEESARTAHIFDLIRRAEHWLQTHAYQNKILKWETEAWGENPADFGRK